MGWIDTMREDSFENPIAKKEEKKYKVRCISCRKEVEVSFPFWKKNGDFYTANCPTCSTKSEPKLAYNSRTEPL